MYSYQVPDGFDRRVEQYLAAIVPDTKVLTTYDVAITILKISVTLIMRGLDRLPGIQMLWT